MIAIQRIVNMKGHRYNLRIRRFEWSVLSRTVTAASLAKFMISKLGFEHSLGGKKFESKKKLRKLNLSVRISFLIPTCEEKLWECYQWYLFLDERGSTLVSVEVGHLFFVRPKPLDFWSQNECLEKLHISLLIKRIHCHELNSSATTNKSLYRVTLQPKMAVCRKTRAD